MVESTCTLGPCAWCGIVKAKGWAQRDHKWTDGSDAALCQSCAVIFDRYAYDLWSSDWSTQRGALAEAISGVPCMLGEKGPDSLTAYAEVADEAHTGNETPWSHLHPGTVEAFRMDRWGQYPKFCPPEHKVEAVERWARKAKLAEMRRSAAAKAAHDKAQVYRF